MGINNEELKIKKEESLLRILLVDLVGESAEALPVADEARRFRGSAPIGGRASARESAGATVGKRPLGRPTEGGCE